MSDSLQPHCLQHARLLCPPLFPRVCSHSRPLSWWGHPTISPCRPVLLLPPILPSIRVFSNESALCISWPSTGVSVSASVLPMNTQGWFPLGLTGLISLQSKGLLRIFSRTTVWKHQFFGTPCFLWSNPHICFRTWLLEKPVALTTWTFVGKVMSLLFNTLSRFVIAFFPRSKCLLTSWLQSLSAVILEHKKIVYHCFPFAMEW